MGSIKAVPGEDWTGEVDTFHGLYQCRVCGQFYPIQREADLCTPAYLIPQRYGMGSVTPEVSLGISEDWLEE